MYVLLYHIIYLIVIYVLYNDIIIMWTQLIFVPQTQVLWWTSCHPQFQMWNRCSVTGFFNAARATIKNKQIGGIVWNDILHPNSSIYMYLLVITCPTVPRSFDIPGSCTGWSWAMRSWRAISWAWWKPNRMIGCPGRTHAPGTAQIQNLLLQFKT